MSWLQIDCFIFLAQGACCDVQILCCQTFAQHHQNSWLFNQRLPPVLGGRVRYSQGENSGEVMRRSIAGIEFCELLICATQRINNKKLSARESENRDWIRNKGKTLRKLKRNDK